MHFKTIVATLAVVGTISLGVSEFRYERHLKKYHPNIDNKMIWKMYREMFLDACKGEFVDRPTTAEINALIHARLQLITL